MKELEKIPTELRGFAAP
jgi:hypothetical protein